MCQDCDAGLAEWGASGSAIRLLPCGENLEAELQEQLLGDACLSPGRVFGNHFSDPLTKFYRNAGPPRSRLPRFSAASTARGEVRERRNRRESVELLIIRIGKRVASNCSQRTIGHMDSQDGAIPRL